MKSDLYYVFSWILAFFCAGILWYLLDRRFFTRPYRLIYNLFHKTPLPAEVERGIIYRQSTGRKFAWAFAFSTVQSVLVVWVRGIAHINPLVEILTWLIEMPALVAGMFAGPTVYGWWINRFKFYKAVDDVESGKINLKEEVTVAVSEQSEKVKKGALALVGDSMTFIARIFKKKPAPKTVVSEPVKPQVPEEDPRELIKRFTKRD